MGEGKIYQAIANVMADVGAVGKDATNTFDKYKYRSIDAVMNAMHPAMAKHRIFVTPEVLEQTREERESKDGSKRLLYSVTKVRYTFFTDDGSSVSAVVIGEGSDRGDKSMNKAMSAAFKYALFQVFCIPTEEMIDSEADSSDLTQKPTNSRNEEPTPVEAKPAAFPFSDYVYAHPKDTINNMQEDAIRERAAKDRVPVEVILTLYKVDSLLKLSNYKYADLMGVHWQQVVEAAAKYKEAPKKTVNINDL